MPGGIPKKQKRNVSFNEEVDIINPEDIDPTIGRFRNLVKSTIVPNANAQPRKLKLQIPDDSKSHIYLLAVARHFVRVFFSFKYVLFLLSSLLLIVSI